MKKQLMIVLALTAVGGLLVVLPSWGQGVAPSPVAPKQEAPARLEAVQLYGSAIGGQTAYPTPGYATVYTDPRTAGANAEMNNLVNQLRDTEDEAKKAELTKQLEAAVSKFFDEDMKNREAELTKLEERLNKLRSQLDRRRKAKAEITELQTKVLVNEAEGLGFSGTSAVGGARSISGSGGFYAPGAVPGFPGAPGAAPSFAPTPTAPTQPRR